MGDDLGPRLVFDSSRIDSGLNFNIDKGDAIGVISFAGENSSNTLSNCSANIVCRATEIQDTSNNNGSDLSFSITAIGTEGSFDALVLNAESGSIFDGNIVKKIKSKTVIPVSASEANKSDLVLNHAKTIGPYLNSGETETGTIIIEHPFHEITGRFDMPLFKTPIENSLVEWNFTIKGKHDSDEDGALCMGKGCLTWRSGSGALSYTIINGDVDDCILETDIISKKTFATILGDADSNVWDTSGVAGMIKPDKFVTDGPFTQNDISYITVLWSADEVYAESLDESIVTWGS